MSPMLTILIAVITFLAGQVVLKFFIEPVLEYKKNVATIDRLLTLQNTRLINDPELLDDLHNSSASLNSSYRAIPLIWMNRRLFFLPTEADIEEARGYLRFLYRKNNDPNSNYDNSPRIYIINARKALKLKV